MNIATQASNRKVLAQAISDEIHEPVRYLGVPSCAYRVGGYTIDRDAVMHGDDFEPLRGFLLRHGYVAADAQLSDASIEPIDEERIETSDNEQIEPTDEERIEPSDDGEIEQTDDGQIEPIDEERIEPTDEERIEPTSEEQSGDGCKAEHGGADDLSERAAPEAYTLTICAPIGEDMTPQMLSNFLRMLYARQDLLAAMTGSALLRLDEEVITLLDETEPDSIEKIAELLKSETAIGMVSGIALKFDRQWTLSIAYRSESDDTVPWSVWQELMNRILSTAKTAKRVNAKHISPDESEMKYFCHTWLMRLRMGGADFKAHRKALLGRLSGYAAFRNGAKMEAHKEKYRLLRHVHAADEETEEIFHAQD